MSRHWGRKVDANQPEIVAALRKAGCSVGLTHRTGNGFPDLVWGISHVTGLLEVKQPGKELDPDQVIFRDAWRGAPVLMARTPEEAVQLVLRAARIAR